MVVHKFFKKTVLYVALTLVGSGITSAGTFVMNALQTKDNKKIQEEINLQFIENDKAVLNILKKMEKEIEFLNKGKS
jgi:hypothetical protein